MQFLRGVVCFKMKKRKSGKKKITYWESQGIWEGVGVGTLTLVSFCLRGLRALCVTNPVLLLFLAKTDK